MTRIIAFQDLFEGAISFERSVEGLSPVRLPVEQEPLFPSPNAMLMSWARAPSGVRMRFATNSKSLVVSLKHAFSESERARLDLTQDGTILDTLDVYAGMESIEFDLAGYSHESTSSTAPPVYELWLDQSHRVFISDLLIEDSAVFAVPDDDRLRWIAYGSSITMCRSATSPARTWPATAARAEHLNLTSLGFGGQCHLDPMVARVVRDRPADIITLKLGINVYGDSSMNARTYPAAVIGLLKIIRERHPLTPIGVMTAIFSCDRETTPNATGCTLEDYRAMTRDAVRRVVECGDQNLRIFEGLDLFGPDDAHMLPDDLHPNGEGYELIGSRAIEQVVQPLLKMRVCE